MLKQVIYYLKFSLLDPHNVYYYKGTLNLKKVSECTVLSKFQYMSYFRIFWCIGLMKNSLGNSTVDPGLLVAQTVKNLPALQETWVRSLGRKIP